MSRRALPPLLVFLSLASLALAGSLGSIGCVTVKPQQRGLLADPIMRFGGDDHDASERAHIRHALDNREGAFGGDGVSGGGCGCN
jgi:hypothetical protein